MAKTKRDKKLYGKMRDHGIRKSVAKDLSKLPASVSGGKQAPKPLRDAVERLEGLVKELKGHTDSGDRKTAARKAARTRSQTAASRSASARKAARTRAKAGASSGSGARSGSAKRTSASTAKSRTGSAASKSRTSASAAKSRTGAAASKPRARRSTAKRTGSRSSGSRS
jgi:hypothetical protein